MLRSAAAVSEGLPLVLEFVDGVADATGGRGVKPKAAGKTRPNPSEQGALF